MSKSVTYIRTIDWLERMMSSRNGNPRYRIHYTDGQTAVTQSDAMVSYGLPNRENIGVLAAAMPSSIEATP